MGADSPLRGGIEMRNPSLVATAALLAIGIFVAAPTHSADTYIENLKNKPEPTDCFESRDGYSNVTRTETAPGSPNVKCSNKTGGVLWWGDAFAGTEPMGELPVEADYTHEEAVVKPRTGQLKYLMPCTACHNGSPAASTTGKNPRPPAPHQGKAGD